MSGSDEQEVREMRFSERALWSTYRSFPSREELGFVPGATDMVVHRAGADEYNFLHDCAIVEHKGELFAAWYNCPEKEIEDASVIRTRRSADEGISWSDPSLVIGDSSDPKNLYAPVVFLSHGGHLYAFVSHMVGHDLVTQCHILIFEEDSGKWSDAGLISRPFLPNCPPRRMQDDNFIIAGRVSPKPGTEPVFPAVAISRGDVIAGDWTVVPLAENLDFQYPESTLMFLEGSITAVVRYRSGRSLLFESSDFGVTWDGPFDHNIPMEDSKVFSGVLSTGQHYLVFNWPTGHNQRDLLVIAVTAPHRPHFSKMWKIRDGYDEHLAAGPQWSYPYAIEYRESLYVVYTSEKKHCALTKIPMASINE